MREIADAAVDAGGVALWWLGQSGYALKTPGGVVALIDPYLSDARSDGGRHARRFPPPVAPADVRCDLVCCTHDHTDHTDPETLLPIVAHTDATVAAPPSACDHLESCGVPAHRLRRLRPGDTVRRSDLSFTATFALHGPPGPADRLPNRPVADPIGLLGICGDVRFAHTGDTLYDDRLLAVAGFRPQALLVCINGAGGNMNAGEAARLTAALNPAIAIPMHYGTIAVNDADPAAFVAAVRATGAPTRVALLRVGERYDIGATSNEQ